MQRTTILFLVVMVEGLLLVLALGLGRWLGVPLSDQIRITLSSTLLGALFGLLLLAAVLIAVRSAWPPLTRVARGFRTFAEQLFPHSSAPDIILMSFAAGLGEEAFFRGFLQNTLASPLGTPAAILLASVVFGLLHLVSLAYAVYASLVGIYLGILLVVCGNLWVPIMAHATYDLVALVILVHIDPTIFAPD